MQTEGKKLEKFKVTYHQNDIETLISTFANQMQLIINFIITYYTKKFLAQLNISILLKLLVDTIEDVKTNSDDDSFYKYEYNLIFIICMIIVSNYYRYGSTQNIDYTILEVLKINKSSYEHQYFDILDDLVKKNDKRVQLYTQFITQLQKNTQYEPLIKLLQANIQSVSSLIDIIRSYIEKIKILINSVTDNRDSLPKCQFDITPEIDFILQLKHNGPNYNQGKCIYNDNSAFIESMLLHFEHIIHALTLFQHEIFNSMRTNLPSIIEKLKDIPTQIVALLEDLNVSMGHTGGADVVEVEEDRQQEQLARQQQAKIAVYEVNTYYVLDIVSWLILEAIFIQKSSFSMIFTYIMDSIKSQHYQVLFTENVNRFDINCKIIMLSICKLIRLLILLCEDIPIDSQAPIYETFIHNLFNTGSTKLIPLTIVIYIILLNKKQIIAYLAQLYNTSEETIEVKLKFRKI